MFLSFKILFFVFLLLFISNNLLPMEDLDGSLEEYVFIEMEIKKIVDSQDSDFVCENEKKQSYYVLGTKSRNEALRRINNGFLPLSKVKKDAIFKLVKRSESYSVMDLWDNLKTLKVLPESSISLCKAILPSELKRLFRIQDMVTFGILLEFVLKNKIYSEEELHCYITQLFGGSNNLSRLIIFII